MERIKKQKARKATHMWGYLTKLWIKLHQLDGLVDSWTVYNEPARANRLSKVLAPPWILFGEWVPRGIGCAFITSVAVHGGYNWINLY